MNNLKRFIAAAMASTAIAASLSFYPAYAFSDDAITPPPTGDAVTKAVIAPIPNPPSSVSTTPTFDDSKAENPFAGHGGNLPPVITYYRKEGIKMTSLGVVGGVSGYLAEAANGKFQTLYASPDGEYVAAGLLFKAGGENITQIQIAQLMARFNDVAKTLPDTKPEDLTEVPADATEKPGENMPILDWLKSKGMKIIPFETKDGGFEGAMVETPVSAELGVSKMQPFYVFPDSHYAVVGQLIQKGNKNITGMQVGALQAKAISEARAHEQSSTPVNPNGVPAVPDLTVPSPSSKTAPVLPSTPQSSTPSEHTSTDPVKPPTDIAAAGSIIGSDKKPVIPPALVAATIPEPISNLEISTKPAKASAPFKSTLDRQSFVESLKTTVFFEVGVKDAPVIYVVADPQCPYCHALWTKLKPLVYNRKLQVRVIMIAGIAGSEPIARGILSLPNPSEAWLKGIGSTDTYTPPSPPLPGSPAWQHTSAYLDANALFSKRWQFDRTPYIAYVGKDDTLYTARGLPEDLDAYLAALK